MTEVDMCAALLLMSWWDTRHAHRHGADERSTCCAAFFSCGQGRKENNECCSCNINARVCVEEKYTKLIQLKIPGLLATMCRWQICKQPPLYSQWQYVMCGVLSPLQQTHGHQ
jgi:hypothetical protein